MISRAKANFKKARVFRYDIWKREALEETKRALKGTVFQYITIKYICPKYDGTYLLVICILCISQKGFKRTARLT